MDASRSPLFRSEALRHRADRLQGNINIATPFAWQAVGFLLLIALAVAIVFLSMASYSRTETVQGVVALDKGVTNIVPSRSGVVAEIKVSEGQPVLAGQRLVLIRAEESMVGGGTAPERIRMSLEQQDIQLAAQSRLLLQAADADRARLNAQIAGNREELPSLEAQITDQKQLIAAAETDYRNAIEVAAHGFISKRDMDTREAMILSRRQQLGQLQQALSAKRAEIAQAERAITQSTMTAQAQAASAQTGRAALAQQVAQADLARGYVITSPVDGVVTALTARLGQPATIDQQLMMVVPAHARPRVELYVPTVAAGFVAPGQEIRISVDAFPYQTFGPLVAQITNMSKAAVTRQGANGPVPAYLLTATLPYPWVEAFGRKHALLPGMTLSARIITEKRSLIAWLFEPLFAVRKR